MTATPLNGLCCCGCQSMGCHGILSTPSCNQWPVCMDMDSIEHDHVRGKGPPRSSTGVHGAHRLFMGRAKIDLRWPALAAKRMNERRGMTTGNVKDACGSSLWLVFELLFSCGGTDVARVLAFCHAEVAAVMMRLLFESGMPSIQAS